MKLLFLWLLINKTVTLFFFYHVETLIIFHIYPAFSNLLIYFGQLYVYIILHLYKIFILMFRLMFARRAYGF